MLGNRKKIAKNFNEDFYLPLYLPLCSGTTTEVLPLVLGVLAAVLLVMAGGTLLAYRHWRNRVTTAAAWSSSSWSSRSSSSKASSGAAAAASSTQYEAVLCYADKDEEFMREIFVPNLAHCGVRHRRWRPQHDQQQQHAQQQPDLYLGLVNGHQPQHKRNINNSGRGGVTSRTVIVLSRSFLAGGEWERLRGSTALHSGGPPLLVLVEELTVLELAAAPELSLLLESCPVLRWDEAGFWPKFVFFLPPGSGGSSSTAGHQAVVGSATSGPALFSGARLHNNNGGGVGGGLNADGSAGSNKGEGTPRDPTQLTQHGMMNPLEQWSDASDSGYGVTKDHIYQTLGKPFTYFDLFFHSSSVRNVR